MNVRKVLIPTDFSENSQKAITAAKIFIDLFDCRVDLIHVVPVSSYLGESISNLGIPIDINNELYPKIIDEANERLLAFAEEHFGKERIGELFLPVDRKPHDAIIRQAKEGEYDMILMSAKGEHSSDFLHGSVTEKTVRYSPIPVLVLDNHIHHEKIKTILIPIDLSSFSFEVIPVAFQLADKFSANLKLLHVMEPYNSGQDFSLYGQLPTQDEITPIDEQEMYDNLISRLEEYFREKTEGRFSINRKEEPFYDEIIFTDSTTSISVPVRTVIEQGFAAHNEIIEYANENADLLVLATHGRTGLQRVFLGSTTEEIVKHLEMPMLTIKPEPEAKEVSS